MVALSLHELATVIAGATPAQALVEATRMAQVAEAAGMGFLFVTYGYAHADYVRPEDSYDCFGAMCDAILAGDHG